MAQLISETEFLAGSNVAGARLIHLADAAGSIHCSITNYGARLVSCIVPDKNGSDTDVALGYASLATYLQQPEEYMGAIVGRCANRIAGGRFSVDGREYQVTQNEGVNTLHGGRIGLHGQLWSIAEISAASLTLRLLSPDGAEGFPGNLSIEVTYSVSANSTLSIHYRATTDAATPVNLSNHAYWNLSGEGSDTITDHLLTLNADAYTPIDASLIPTGVIADVSGTPFGFRRAAAIGNRIDAEDEQLHHGKGYDHNWVLSHIDGPAATLSSPLSGIALRLFSTAPGLQFYSGNGLSATRAGKSGKHYGFRSAVVLEPQAYPDSIHHRDFQDVVLRPGVLYERTDVYSFSKKGLV